MTKATKAPKAKAANTDEAKVVATISAKAKDVANTLTQKQLYTTTAQITDAVAKAVKTGMSVQQAYQRIACSAIVHLGTHKDIRVIRNILDTLPVGMRKQSLSAYFDAFAPVSFDAESNIHYDKSKPVKLAEALKTSWWMVAKEAAYTPVVFTAELERLLNKFEKRVVTATPDKGDAITTAQVNAFAKFVASLSSKAKADPLAA